MGGQITVTTDALTITGSKKYVAKHTTLYFHQVYTIKVLENTISNIESTINNNMASDVFSFTYVPSTDTTAPTFSQGSVPSSGDKVILEFSEALTTTAPVPPGFEVILYGAGSGSMNSVAIDPTDSSKIIITMTSASIYNTTYTTGVRVEYTAPEGNSNILKDAAGNKLESFVTLTTANGDASDDITNNSSQSPAPTMTITATKPSGSSLNSGTTTYDEYIKVTFTSNVAVSSANQVYSFIESDITISGPGQIKHDSFSTISSTVFEAEIEPTDASVTYDSPLQSISISVAANTYTDTNGNNNTASNTYQWTQEAIYDHSWNSIHQYNPIVKIQGGTGGISTNSKLGSNIFIPSKVVDAGFISQTYVNNHNRSGIKNDAWNNVDATYPDLTNNVLPSGYGSYDSSSNNTLNLSTISSSNVTGNRFAPWMIEIINVGSVPSGRDNTTTLSDYDGFYGIGNLKWDDGQGEAESGPDESWSPYLLLGTTHKATATNTSNGGTTVTGLTDDKWSYSGNKRQILYTSNSVIDNIRIAFWKYDSSTNTENIAPIYKKIKLN